MILNFIMWFLSFLFITAGLAGFIAQDPMPASFLLLFGLIVNPKISNKLKSIHSIFSKKWFKPAVFILCMSLFISSIEPIEVNDDSINMNNLSDTETLVERTNTNSPEDVFSEVFVPNIEENTELIVHYLDVGQADSIFIELPNKQTILIDAGNNADDETIVNYIKNLNYDTINYVVGTHPHEDHIGGLDTVIDTFIIENIYMPKVLHNTTTFEDVLFAIQNKGLKVNTAKAGVNILNIDNLNIDIIAPVNEEYSNLNDYSAVIKITYKDNSFLFMGDAELASESEITADVKSDVLKIGHHGSNTSTSREFLTKVKPTYAVLSVGKDNSYGHPSDEVLALLDEFDIAVFRTDEHGTIIAQSDGDTVYINKEPSPYETNAPPPMIQEATNTPQVIENAPVVEEPAPVIEEPKEIIVYITKTGSKYHSGGCRYLSKSKIAISLQNAKSSYGACSVCNPPR